MTDGSDDPEIHEYQDEIATDILYFMSIKQLLTINGYPLISSRVTPCPTDTLQLHLVTVSLGMKLSYRALNDSTSCNCLGFVSSPALNVHRMPTSRNPKFPQKNQIEANRKVPVIWFY